MPLGKVGSQSIDEMLEINNPKVVDTCIAQIATVELTARIGSFKFPSPHLHILESKHSGNLGSEQSTLFSFVKLRRAEQSNDLNHKDYPSDCPKRQEAESDKQTVELKHYQ